jgi:peptidyl-prolyl cis-trans isomerase D
LSIFTLVDKYKKVIQIFLALIAITFMTWGIESYTQFRGSRDAVAIVDGLEISQREFSQELQRQQEQLRQVLGRNFDPAVMDTPESRKLLIDQMIAQRLVASQAVKANLTVTDEVLRDTIASIPAFHVDGKFNKQTYETMLRAQNPPMTPAQFESRLRYDLSVAQLTGALTESAIPPRVLAERLVGLEAQKREIAEARIPAQQFLPQVKVDDAKARAYYEANPADFRTPERLKAEYVVLSAAQLGKLEPVTEEELKKAYEARASQYKVDEQRRASHILVKTKEEADKILAEVKANPSRFPELAKKHSQDTGSAEKGGDLGWFGRGMMVKPFEDAAFTLPQNTMQVVQSEFGFHVLRVTGVQGAKARPFEEVRKEIADELEKQKGARKFAEAAEAFTNTVYEQPDSLKPAAEKFKLQVQTTGWVAKAGGQELGALDNPKLLAALFSPDSVKNRRNTDAIEVAPSTLVAARVVEHQPAAQLKFDEVKNDIVETLKRREAAELAQKDGAAKLEKLRNGEDAGLKWGAAKTVSRRDPQGLPADILRRVVSAEAGKLPAYVGIPVPEAGYLLVRISKVIDSDPKEVSAETVARVGQLLGASQHEAYIASLRKQAKIEIKPGNLEKKQ